MTEPIVKVLERWTETAGWRKVEDGPWEPIDLTPFGGRVPVIFIKPGVTEAVTETWMSEEEAQLKGLKP